MTTLDTVRRLIGRRHKISRQEMMDILVALDLPPEASTICGRDQHGRLIIGTGRVQDCDFPAADQERSAMARAWANRCTGILCISVLRGSYYVGDALTDGLTVRYDEPGSMHPMQRADLLFAPAELAHYDYDQIGQLRGRANKVLVVRDDSPIADPDAPKPAPLGVPRWITMTRKCRHIDGVWNRLLDDGTLEIRDPNDGQSSDPRRKSRHQYRVTEHAVERRHLPPETVGDAWQDIGVPKWQPCDPGGLVGEIIERIIEERFA